MKKLMSLLLAAMLVLGLAACGGQTGGAPDTNQPENGTAPVSDESAPSEPPSAPAAPETITITSLNGNREPAELEVPYDPQRVAILDMASLDILDALGVPPLTIKREAPASGRSTSTKETRQMWFPSQRFIVHPAQKFLPMRDIFSSYYKP